MSSTENKTDVATQRAEEKVKENEKASGDLKSESSPTKRTASEINNAEDEGVKQKVLKKKKMVSLKINLKVMKMRMKKEFLKVMIMMKEMKMGLMKRVMKMKMMHKKS
ncbi:uncharacterized protein LOC143225501 isoform X2 [Tachypleus tridentatus]|uniref:uncharacterized protein LOC143225501 isoform X2 n=1 Tax=Tachypleus tridentatus TaxID=6853 RepID=UPI003FD1B4F4